MPEVFGFAAPRHCHLFNSLNRSSAASVDNPKTWTCKLGPDATSDGISANNVSFWWENGRIALRDVSVHVAPGELTMVVGRNGSGKSTLLHTIIGKLNPARGSTSAEPPCAFIHQNADVQILFPTVGLDVSASVPKTPETTVEYIQEEVIRVMRTVGLDPTTDFLNTSSFRLSGGQKQRVVVAGALAMRPKTILFDEATASMDPVSKSDLMSRIRKIVHEHKIAALWVTHLLDELELADNIIIMEEGSIVAQGPMVEMMPFIYDMADGF